MLMKFMQQEYFSGGRISRCFQMKTAKIKCFPEESAGNYSACSFAPFILNAHPACCCVCSEYLVERLANISQMTEPTESGCWKMWEPLPACLCVGKDGNVCRVIIKQTFLLFLSPIWSYLWTERSKWSEKGCLGRNSMKWGKIFFFYFTSKDLSK